MNDMRKLMEAVKQIDEEIKSGIPGGRPFIDLSGPGGNAFAIMGNAKSYAKQLGLDGDAIIAEMQAGDYENLLSVFDNYFGDYVDLYRGDSEESIDEEFGNAPDARKVTNKLHELMDEQMLDPRAVADAALRYMSEVDVADMAHSNELISDEDGFEESVEVIDDNILREYREDSPEEIAAELEDIKGNIANLIHDAGTLVDMTDERDAARAYWIGHILGALDNDSEYRSGSMTTMQDSIDAIREGSEDEEDDGSWAAAERANR